MEFRLEIEKTSAKEETRDEVEKEGEVVEVEEGKKKVVGGEEEEQGRKSSSSGSTLSSILQSFTGSSSSDGEEKEEKGKEEKEFDFEADRKDIIEFFKSNDCYKLMPESGKTLIFDTRLSVEQAYRALAQHGLNSAPLYDSDKMKLTGIFSMSDFIDVLSHFYVKSEEHQSIQERNMGQHKIAYWRELTKDDHKKSSRPQELISLSPEDSLFDSCALMIEHGIHRVAIVDPGDPTAVLHIQTHIALLRFMVRQLQDKPKIFQHSLEETGIGTFQNIATVFKDTPLITVLRMLKQRQISAVPVVDEHGVLHNIYSRADVTHLAAMNDFYNLDVTIEEALQYRKRRNVHTCNKSDTLRTCVYRLASRKVHRLICVDSQNCVVGVVSLTDILKFLLGLD